MDENSLRSLFDIATQQENPPALLQSLKADKSALFQVQDLTTALSTQNREWQSLAQTAVTSAGKISESLAGSSGKSIRALERIGAEMIKNITLQQKDAVEAGKAEASKSLLTISALKQRAPVQAAMQLAAAFGDLGDLNFWGAAQHFASAALYGGVAAAQIASAAGSLSGGSMDSGSHGDFHHRRLESSAGEVGAPVSGLAAGAAAALNQPSGHLTVAIMGDDEAGEWLAKTLNTAVEQRGVQLTASRAERPAYAQG